MTLFGELKRRNVFRVGIAYLALAWLLTEVAGTLFPAFGIPDWGVRFVVIVFALGFVPALIISWIYELTPEGIKREREVVRDASITHLTAKRLDMFTISLIVVAFVFILADRLWLSPQLVEKSETVAVGTDTKQTIGVEPQYSPDSIAVLPFANRSANPDDAFFVDGIHDDLLTYISQIGSIKTISRTSVMKYRDTTRSIPEIARELGVATVLEGGVQRAGEQVRINVQLIDARTDDHLWSQIYDRQLTATNIFAIQSEIAGAIADALRATLTPEAQDRIKNIPTENLEALESYFLARQSMAARVVSDLTNAVEQFEHAVALDPSFALAWVGLADAYLLLWGYGGDITKSDAFAKSQVAVEQALKLDHDLGEAYASEGKRKNWMGDREGAETAFKKALSLNPNYAPTYQWYGEMLRNAPAGRIEEALELFSQAVELDPLSPILHRDYGRGLEAAGRFDEALARYREAIEIDSDFYPAHRNIGYLYWAGFGQVHKAVPQLLKGFPENSSSLQMLSLALAYLDLGDDQQADIWLRQSLQHRQEGYSHNFSSLLHLFRGEENRALEFAERALTEGPRSDFLGWIMLALLAERDLEMGDHAGAFTRYELSYPRLFSETGPEIDRQNHKAAIGLAAVLLNAGETARAEQLFDQCIILINEIPRKGAFGYGILDVQVAALRGEKDKALAALRQATNQNWRLLWWFYLDHDPALKSLRNEPGFQEIKAAIEADMAEQLALVRELEATEHLPLVPATENELR